MPYIPNTPEDQRAMLEAIGVATIDELFASIPPELRLKRPLDIPPALSEMELTAHLTALAAKNAPAGEKVCFLGGGSYDHFIPAVVDYVGSRGEFYTSYTPYQPEASQGNLQVFFEYQTLITQLTGMDVSNASLYDGGSAAAEAVLMAMSATGRHGRVVTAASVHPEYRQILATYLANLGIELVTVGTPDGTISPDDLAAAVNDETACVLVQHPNFFGCLEPVEAAWPRSPTRPAPCSSSSVDPISLGLLKRPGDYGADIVVAEGQILGSPMPFGGPYLGIMACREQFVRRMPGRIVGQTVDRRGKRCLVLTLQTREQHIRREKATSNICTNQGLFALRAAVYLAALGPQGLRETAELCLRKRATPPSSSTADGALRAGLRRPDVQGVRRPRRQAATSTSCSAAACERRLSRRRAAGALVPRAGRLLPGGGDRKAHARQRSTAWPAVSTRAERAIHAKHPSDPTAVRTVEARPPRRASARVRRARRPLAELLPAEALAAAPPPLPELTEPELVRHFANLSTQNMSVDTHFYPLGSCTMKYNPKRNERLASLPGFVDLHPYQPDDTLQGMLELLCDLQEMLAEIAGLPAVSLQPAAGATARLTALLVAAAYFRKLGQKRTKVLAPDSAHGTIEHETERVEDTTWPRIAPVIFSTWVEDKLRVRLLLTVWLPMVDKSTVTLFAEALKFNVSVPPLDASMTVSVPRAESVSKL